MKKLFVATCFLAAATVVRGIDEDTVVPKYMEYLMPDIEPCAEQFHMTDEEATNIQYAQNGDLRQLGCFKACVMRRMEILTGATDFHLEPIYKMIDIVHADNADDMKLVRTIAVECVEDIKGEPDECNIGNKYTDCYIAKLFA